MGGGSASHGLLATQPPPPIPSVVELPALPTFPEIWQKVMDKPAVKQAWQSLVQARRDGYSKGVDWNHMAQTTQEADAVVKKAILVQKSLIDSGVEALGELRLQWIEQGYPEDSISDHAVKMGQLLLTHLGNGIMALFSINQAEEPQNSGVPEA